MSIRSKPSSKEYQEGWERIFAAQRLMCSECKGAGYTVELTADGEDWDFELCSVCDGTGTNTKT